MTSPLHKLIFRSSKDPPSADDKDENAAAAAATPAAASPRSAAASPRSASLMNLHSERSWNVKMPPIKKHMVGGHLVPTARSAIGFLSQKRRYLRVEVRGPQAVAALVANEDVDGDALNDSDIVLVRIFRRLKHAKISSGASLASNPSSDDDDEHDNESLTIASLPALEVEDDPDFANSWKEHQRYKLEDMHILKTTGKIVEIRIGAGHDVVVRDIKFDSDHDATSFQQVVDRLKQLQQERTQAQVARYKLAQATAQKKLSPSTSPSSGSSPTTTATATQEIKTRDLVIDDEGEPVGTEVDNKNNNSDETIDLLVEIVSASNLPVADIGSSDPYIIVRMGGNEVHRTSIISNDLNPIWTLDKGSLFLLQMTPEQFFACTGGMSFVLKDYDQVGSNEILGSVSVPLEELLEGKGKRTGFLISLGPKSEKTDRDHDSTLYLRFKKASESDIKFMKAFKLNEKKLGVYLNETYLPIRPPYSKALKGQRKKAKDSGEMLFRVKPFPDPEREDETKWMTESQIEAESNKESTHWVEAGSGKLGKVYFEIIGCNGLPNMDASSRVVNLRDKTDAFACVVFEDCIVNSDVITDSLSPRWLPWCHRAFVFHIGHPSSDVLLAILDHDPELGPAQLLTRTTYDLHDPIGRARINLSKLVPGTTYNLVYPLFYGESVEHRQKDRGTVHVRVRLEFEHIGKAMVAGLLPPADTYVSVANKVDFEVANYTVDGIVDERDFSMAVFTKYIEELQSYKDLIDFLLEAALAVWLWRGHYKVKIGGKVLWLPLHSIVLYIWMILVTWNFNLFPSFLLFAVGWTLLATNEHVKRDPSSWRSSRGYFELLRLLLFNSTSPEKIESNHRISEIKEYDDKVKAAAEKRKARKDQEAKQDQELGALQGQVETEDIDIASGNTGILKKVNVNPLQPVLYPIQKKLRKAVELVRIIKTIILWETTYYAFWIVTIAFLASAVVSVVPWAFLMRWLLRVTVWICLGPWMMLVDKYYFHSKSEDGDDAINKRLKDRYLEIQDVAMHSRIRKERALKLKALKRFCFGKYLVHVPKFNHDVCWDAPLPVSHANPSAPAESIVNIVEKKYGQNLSGDMVPQRDIQAAEATKGSLTKKKKTPIWKKKLPMFRLKRDTHGQDEKAPLLAPHSDKGRPRDYQAAQAESEEVDEEEEEHPNTGKRQFKMPTWFSPVHGKEDHDDKGAGKARQLAGKTRVKAPTWFSSA